MTDIVVKVDVRDDISELKLFEAIAEIISQTSEYLGIEDEDQAPDIMVKSVPEGEFTEKAVIFQSQSVADTFVRYWSRIN